MLSTRERKRLIDKIRQFPADIRPIVGSLDDAQLDQPCGQDEWTIRQVTHHLADSHMNSFIRFKLILTEDKPTLRPYDQEAWARLPDTVGLPVEVSLGILDSLHLRWTSLLDSLSEAQWKRSGFHPEIGEVTLEDMLVTYARHGDEHIEQISRATND